MYRILIVEDDAVIGGEIARKLAEWGYETRLADDLTDVLGCFERFDPHLVLMDVSLPALNGFYWCAEIRKTSKVPVVFLSSRADNMDVVMAMSMGGDDYLTKPVSFDVLVAKVQAILRRAYDYEAAAKLTLADAVLDPAALTITRGSQKVDLTRNEAKILQLLLANRGKVTSREQLMLALWDSDVFVDDNTLTVNVNRLRKTLASLGLPDCIATRRKEGYALHA